ncbi:leucine-rich repeat extensin-like protein 3 [Iris pallida]|uniref:Leucine-rich repeat extensin-like protein 3 n=1 Tax=Iris pallida TaxID=29817 RepID=A0AAX6DK45_IRIPA|nr:leucine-rich repeat extensin-like protein 3 [Iris pallida]KAJ6810009.1 leucine-rich repeat extensin-like protein 3 [Iris pallida]
MSVILSVFIPSYSTNLQTTNQIMCLTRTRSTESPSSTNCRPADLDQTPAPPGRPLDPAIFRPSRHLFLLLFLPSSHNRLTLIITTTRIAQIITTSANTTTTTTVTPNATKQSQTKTHTYSHHRVFSSMYRSRSRMPPRSRAPAAASLPPSHSSPSPANLDVTSTIGRHSRVHLESVDTEHSSILCNATRRALARVARPTPCSWRPPVTSSHLKTATPSRFRRSCSPYDSLALFLASYEP